MADLKPCPFCGSDEITVGSFASAEFERHYVKCEECDCAAQGHDCEADAIAAWNRRAAPADKQGGGLSGEEVDWLVREWFGRDAIVENGLYNVHRFREFARAVLARVAPSGEPVAWKWRRHKVDKWQSEGHWDASAAGYAADLESKGFDVVRLYAAPQPSKQQAEPETWPSEEEARAYVKMLHAKAKRQRAEQPAEEVRGVDDAIAKSKRILALVDDYAERQTSERRTALRVALMNEFEALLAAPAAAPATEQAEQREGE